MSGEKGYYSYFAFDAEGHRIGLMTCKRCGAAVLLAKGEDGPKIHDEWHRMRLAERTAIIPAQKEKQ